MFAAHENVEQSIRIVGCDCWSGGRLVTMHEINRGLLLVFPKRPFVDWLNSVDPEGSRVTLDDLWREPEAILVEEFESDEEAERLLQRLYGEVFDHMLMEWHTNVAGWPATRDHRTFREWFEVRSLSMVFDQAGDEIRHLD